MAEKKIYKTIEQLQSDLQAQWLERMDFYKNKYPNLDYDLEIQSMQEWIEKDYNKAKKYHAWNLFIQRWLSRARPAWSQKKYNNPTDNETRIYEFYKKLVTENQDDMYLSLYMRKVKEYEDKYGKLED